MAESARSVFRIKNTGRIVGGIADEVDLVDHVPFVSDHGKGKALGHHKVGEDASSTSSSIAVLEQAAFISPTNIFFDSIIQLESGAQPIEGSIFEDFVITSAQGSNELFDGIVAVTSG